MKTIIINDTKESFQLKEGNAGAYRLMDQLTKGSRIPIKVDPNATYREYMIATGKKGETIIVTSDDFSEYEVITIVVDTKSPSGYNYVPSKPRKGNVFAANRESLSAEGSATPAPNLTAAGRESAPTGEAGVQAVAAGAGVQSDPAVSPPVSSHAEAEAAPTGEAGVQSAAAGAGVQSDPAVSPPVSSHAEAEPAPTGAAGVQSVAAFAGVQSDPAVPPPVGEGQATPPVSSHAEHEPALRKTKKKAPWYRKLKLWK